MGAKAGWFLVGETSWGAKGLAGLMADPMD